MLSAHGRPSTALSSTERMGTPFPFFSTVFFYTLEISSESVSWSQCLQCFVAAFLLRGGGGGVCRKAKEVVNLTDVFLPQLIKRRIAAPFTLETTTVIHYQ